MMVRLTNVAGIIETVSDQIHVIAYETLLDFSLIHSPFYQFFCDIQLGLVRLFS